MEAEALAVRDVAHVAAQLAVGPEEIADRGKQVLDVIVLLDERGHVAGGARGGNVFERLRRLRIEAHAGHVLRKQRDERQAEALIEIRDELIARHLLKLAVVGEALLERQMPVHVVGVPPGVLQALPEKPRLANAADFVPARDDALFAILADQVAQGENQLGLQLLEALVVYPQICGGVAALFRGRGFVRFRFREGPAGEVPRSKDRGYSASSVSVGGSDGAGRGRPSLSCGIRVHSVVLID